MSQAQAPTTINNADAIDVMAKVSDMTDEVATPPSAATLPTIETTADIPSETVTDVVAHEIAQKSETAKEVATEVVHATAENLTTASDYTLHLLGIPVDTTTLIQNSASFGIRLILAVLIFFIGKWIGKHIVNIAKKAMQRSSLDGAAVSFLSNLLYGVVLAAVVLAALNQLGISTTSFVAVLGALTVAIGVSLKDQVSNLAAGVLIVIFRPFQRGDSVEVAGRVGTVQEITLVNTRIRTPNNHEIIIPNGDIMTTATVNYSSFTNRRIEVEVGIGYDSDIRQARDIMVKLACAHKDVLDSNEPFVRVVALADSSVNLVLYAWTANDTWYATQCDLLEQVKYAFDEHGINIPFPIRTVYIDGLDKLVQSGDK